MWFEGRWMEEIMLSEVNIKVTCFLSYVKDRYKYKYKYIYRMFPKVELLEETKGREKEEKNDSK
jgi:hypothetical protein